jgi:hypothetical protein
MYACVAAIPYSRDSTDEKWNMMIEITWTSYFTFPALDHIAMYT